MLHSAPRGSHRPGASVRRLRRLTPTSLLVAVLVAATLAAVGASSPRTVHRYGSTQRARPPAAGGVHSAPGGAAGACGSAAALNTVAGTVCVHGDDTAFAPGTVHAEGHPSGRVVPRAIPCHRNGRSGNRIAVYYAYIAGNPNRVGKMRRRIRAAIEQANDVVFKSARQTGGKRWLRVLTNGRCLPIVRSLRLPRRAADSFGNTINAASAAGLHAANRKYILFVDSTAICGIATLRYDQRPGPGNVNNSGPSWARVDRGCWSGLPAAHEIFHMLGAVQPGAPHFDNTGHCTDDRDLMCYQNRGGKRVYIRCNPAIDDDRLDCGKDDYFNTAPRRGSYLARHWNTARSSFLYNGGPALPKRPGRVRAPVVTMTGLTTARVRWAAPAGRVTRYEVLKNGYPVWHGTARRWTDTSAYDGGGNYQVRAVNEAGPGSWSTSVDAALPLPSAPQDVTGISTSSVVWTGSATFVQYYFLYGLRDDGTTQYLGAWPPTARSATDKTYSFLRTWQRYRVCAYNTTGSACTDETT